MPTINHKAVINVPREELFDYSQSKSLRMSWDPFVSDVKLDTPAEFPSEGSEVTVRTWNGMEMTCEYVRYDRPHFAAIRMLRGPLVLQQFGGSWRFEAISPLATETTFSYSFRTRGGFLRKLIAPVARIYFSWDMKRRIAALKQAAESWHAAVMNG